MTLKEKILNLLSDGKERHQLNIAKVLKANPDSIATYLTTLRNEGAIEEVMETVTITKRRTGFVRIANKSVRHISGDKGEDVVSVRKD